MKEAEKILEKFARKNMIEWNQESFKRTHSRLHKSIVEAISEALTIPVVVGQSEQLADHQCKFYVNADWTKLKCECGKEQLPKG